MGLLAETGRAAGRWIVAPRKGAQFIGAANRARARARGRRRRVLVFLLEATGITLLMGLFPPLRPLVYAAAFFGVLLVVYVGMLLAMRRNERELARMRRRFEAEVERAAPAAAVAKGVPVRTHRRPTKPVPQVIHLEDVHVVIRPARRLQTASAR
jgi:hypothetical protein